jgi:predicted nucleic acid-binding protein
MGTTLFLRTASETHLAGNVVGLPNLMVEQQREIAEALDGFERGLDFADALHLASSRRAGRFATFDKKLFRRAEKLTDMNWC